MLKITRGLTFLCVVGVLLAANQNSHLTQAYASSSNIIAWGTNASGQLGNGTIKEADVPQIVANLQNVVDVAAGANHSLAVEADGSVWAWGDNSAGELGQAIPTLCGSTPCSDVPIRVPGLPAIKSVTAGSNSSFAIDLQGNLWSWGNDTDGAIGQYFLGGQPCTCISNPQQVPGLDHIVEVAATNNWGAALRNDGTVWVWGEDAGQTCPFIPFYRGPPSAAHCDQVPVQVPGLTGILRIAVAGSGVLYAVFTSGNVGVWTWPSFAPYSGLNYLPISAARDAATDGNTLLVQKWDGTLLTSGDNSVGQLGVGDTLTHTVPTQPLNITSSVQVSMGLKTAWAVDSAGTLLGWGDNTNFRLVAYAGSIEVPASLKTGVSMVSGGQGFVVAVINPSSNASPSPSSTPTFTATTTSSPSATSTSTPIPATATTTSTPTSTNTSTPLPPTATSTSSSTPGISPTNTATASVGSPAPSPTSIVNTNVSLTTAVHSGNPSNGAEDVYLTNTLPISTLSIQIVVWNPVGPFAGPNPPILNNVRSYDGFGMLSRSIQQIGNSQSQPYVVTLSLPNGQSVPNGSGRIAAVQYDFLNGSGASHLYSQDSYSVVGTTSDGVPFAFTGRF